METYFTAQEIARLLKVNYRKILEEILSGRLRAIKIGRQYRISRSDFSLYMDLNAVS